jgi:peptidoglycan/LPS O-acetylase OafA/YrhL
VIGLVGLAVNSSFHTGAAMTSGDFLGFRVNGWDDVVPGVAFGLALLAGTRGRGAARAACRLVALGYLVLMVAGIAGGDDAFGFVPAGAADDVLRGLLALVLLAAAAVSKDRRDTLARDRVVVSAPIGEALVVGPGSGHVGGPRAIQARIDRRLPEKTHP